MINDIKMRKKMGLFCMFYNIKALYLHRVFHGIRFKVNI